MHEYTGLLKKKYMLSEVCFRKTTDAKSMLCGWEGNLSSDLSLLPGVHAIILSAKGFMFSMVASAQDKAFCMLEFTGTVLLSSVQQHFWTLYGKN